MNEPAAGKAKIRVMVFDDHAMFREGIISLLRMHSDFEVIGQAGDGETALALYRQHRPDVALVDLRMPRRDGVSLIRALISEFPASRLLVLTTYDTEDDVSRALKAGARGYLLKGASGDVLADAIRVVQNGRRYIPPDLADRVLPGPGEEPLTMRETEVLKGIARGLSNKEIGESLGLTESTVKTYVNSLLSKLGVTDRTNALIVALRRGLVQLD